MAVYRNSPTCLKCGKEYKGIYRDNDGTFMGDDFIRWDIEGHECERNDHPLKNAPNRHDPILNEAYKQVYKNAELKSQETADNKELITAALNYARNHTLELGEKSRRFSALIAGAQWLSSQRKDGWIDCSDELPEENKVVLIYEVFEDLEEVHTGFFNGVSFDYNHDDYHVTTYNVTHWMPLPSPPQAKPILGGEVKP